MRKLEVGILEDAPEGALACWGGLATIRHGRWFIPHERQDIVGEPREREALAQVMNDGTLREAERLERDLWRQRAYPPGVVVHLLERPELVVLTSYRDGCVFVTAYTRKPERVRKAARMGRRRKP